MILKSAFVIPDRFKLRMVYGCLDQCTGKHDKHGELIYENDIIDILGHRYIVEWNDISWHLHNDRHDGPMRYLENAEIVGNIHQNQELYVAT